LLNLKAIEQLLWAEIRRWRVDGLFAAADRLAELDLPPLSDDEIELEIDRTRKAAAV